MARLAGAAGLSISTVKRMEMATPQAISDQAYATLRAGFEAAGIRFLDDDDGNGTGMRLGTP